MPNSSSELDAADSLLQAGARALRNAEMVQAWNDGATVSQIARANGLSVSWTGRLLRLLGVVMPTAGKGIKLDIDYRVLREAYEKGATVRGLADAAGISYCTMHRGLAAAGVTFRPRGKRPVRTSPTATGP